MNKVGKLYIVGTPIGNIRDITIRALDTLKEVDLILAEDTRQTLKLLNHYEIVKRQISYHRHNEAEKINQVIKLLDEGNNIALVSDAGMPCVSDPGYLLVIELVKRGYDIEVIPGVTALITAVVKSGIDTTRFSFEGFLSVNKKQRKERLQEVKNDKRTLIFYEAPHKIINTLKDVLDILGDRNICIARELTKVYEEHIRGKVTEILDHFEKVAPKGEMVLIIEGKTEEELKHDKELELENVTEEELLIKYLKEGLTRKEAVKRVAKEKNKDKNEIYKICISLNK